MCVCVIIIFLITAIAFYTRVWKKLILQYSKIEFTFYACSVEVNISTILWVLVSIQMISFRERTLQSVFWKEREPVGYNTVVLLQTPFSYIIVLNI